MCSPGIVCSIQSYISQPLSVELLTGILYAETLFQWQYKGLLQNTETGSSYEESDDWLVIRTCIARWET